MSIILPKGPIANAAKAKGSYHQSFQKAEQANIILSLLFSLWQHYLEHSILR
jgi:hypothetical protein